MKPERAIIAHRPLAQHCAELLNGRGKPADPLESLFRAVSAMAAPLARELARITAGDAPRIEAAPARHCTVHDLADENALAAAMLFAMAPGDAPVIAVIGGDTIFRLLDRAFGGRGNAPDPLPASFPLSAELLRDRIETMLIAALTQISGSGVSLRPVRRASSVAKLDAVAAETMLAAIKIDVTEPGQMPWPLIIAVPAAAAAVLAPPMAEPRTAPRQTRRQPVMTDDPFADIPLTLRAVLVDMPAPFSRIAGLRPGDILPVAVARDVPLIAGTRTVAIGTSGALDDRVAVRVTRAFPT